MIKLVDKKVIDNLDIILFILLVPLKVILFGSHTSSYKYYWAMLISPVFSSCIALMAITMLFKNKHRTRLLYTLDIIISSFLVTDIVYGRYFKDLITLGAMKNGVLLGGMGSSVKSLIHPKDFVYLLDVFILIPFFKFYRKVDRKQLAMKFRTILFVVIFAFSIFVDGSHIYKLSNEQPALLRTMSNRIYITNVLGNVNFHILDAYNTAVTTLEKHQKLDDSKVQDIKAVFATNEGISANKQANLNGIGKGKNLIVIQVEALQQFVIGSSINGQEITPNLNKWFNRSMYFDNYFYQVAAGNTSDAEFLSLNSLYPADTGAAYLTYSGDTFSSLPIEMKEKGYYTAALHGYREGFWNRNVMYKSEGFDNFFGEHSFNQDETVGLGLSDKSFLTQTADKLKGFKSPYFSFVITLSSHYPYDDQKGYGDFDVAQYKGTFLGNYLNGIHYADAQLGMFLQKLQDNGTLDNSIVVLYGDHYAIPKNNIDELYKFEGIDNPTDLDYNLLQKVPMAIHFPKDQYKGVNHTYGGQIDLYPTISNLFNLSNKYMLGKDLLNAQNGDVFFRKGSFTDGKVFYVDCTDSYYDIKTGNKIEETEELKNKKEEVLTRLEYSDDVLNHNLLEKFKEEDKQN